MFHAQIRNKIVNPYMANRALQGGAMFGAFEVIVKLADHGALPAYMKNEGMHSPGHLKARIACDQLDRVHGDGNLVSVELREYVSR